MTAPKIIEGNYNMKRWICVLLGCALVLGLVACGGANNTEDASGTASSVPQTASAASETIQFTNPYPTDGDPAEHTVEEIQARGTLIAAIVNDNPPFSFLYDDGETLGMDYSMADTLAGDLGVALEIKTGTAKEVIAMVRSGEADVALGGFLQGDSAISRLDESKPYAGGTQQLLVRIEDKSKYSSLSRFATQTFVCLDTTKEQRDALKAQVDKSLCEETRSMERGLALLRSGTVAALMSDAFRIGAVGEDTPDVAALTLDLGEDTYGAAYVIGVMKDNESLLHYINSEIDKYTPTNGLGRLMLQAVTRMENVKLDWGGAEE